MAMEITSKDNRIFRDLRHLSMSLAELIVPLPKLADNIDRCILSEDEMSDNASSELRSIRRGIIRQNEAIKNRMNQILNSADNKPYLQDSIVTMQDAQVF